MQATETDAYCAIFSRYDTRIYMLRVYIRRIVPTLVGVYRDQCLVVEGHASLLMGLVFVPLWFPDRRWFGLVCPAEALF